MLSLPIAWLFLAMGCNVYYVGWAVVLTTILNTLNRVYHAWRIVGMSIWHWLFRVVLPNAVVIVICALLGCFVIFCFDSSFWRVCLTTGCTEMVLLPLLWFLVLDTDEREYVKGRISVLMSRFYG